MNLKENYKERTWWVYIGWCFMFVNHKLTGNISDINSFDLISKITSKFLISIFK